MQSFRLQALDTFVCHPDTEWLKTGRYLKYVFFVRHSELPDNAKGLLLNVPAMTVMQGTGGETIYEMIDAPRDCCLSVISDPQEGVRMQVWLKSGAEQRVKVLSLPERRAPAG
jgi:hypothetical protein